LELPVTLEQLFLQLGICGAMLLVWFRIESKRIDRNASVEDKKTEALAAGFKSLAELVGDHARADQESHSKQVDRLAAIESTLSLRIKTPAKGVPMREVVRRTDER
jgi:hypothetical protein